MPRGCVGSSDNCGIEGCPRNPVSRGFCQYHYAILFVRFRPQDLPMKNIVTVGLMTDYMDQTIDPSSLRSSDEDDLLLLRQAMSGLSPREKGVLIARYGIGQREHTLREVGKKYNVSQERARQIELKAIQKLQRWVNRLRKLVSLNPIPRP